jgi:hypothetical protein
LTVLGLHRFLSHLLYHIFVGLFEHGQILEVEAAKIVG